MPLVGQPKSPTLNSEALNNFNDSVVLSVVSSPSASNVILFPSNVKVRPGSASTVTLSFNSSAAYIYILTITGQSEGSSHSINVTVIIQDFKISVSPPILRHGRLQPNP